MNRTHAYVGPRGWAVLTLAGSAALASPFLRPPQLDSTHFGAPSSLAPNFAGETISTNASAANQRAANLTSAHALPGRVVSGVLPTTVSKLDDFADFADASPPQLPAWVKPRSPLDDLIARGTAQLDSAQLDSFLAVETPRLQAHVELEPLRPWRGSKLPLSGQIEPAALVLAKATPPTLPPLTHHTSPWQIGPADGASSSNSQRLAHKATQSDGLVQGWPDQTLGYVHPVHVPSEALASEPTDRGFGDPWPRTGDYPTSGQQRTVAAPVASTAAATATVNPSAPSIGATLSRSYSPSTLPRGASLRATDAPATPTPPTTATADSKVNEHRFVYQPGLKKP